MTRTRADQRGFFRIAARDRDRTSGHCVVGPDTGRCAVAVRAFALPLGSRASHFRVLCTTGRWSETGPAACGFPAIVAAGESGECCGDVVEVVDQRAKVPLG